MHKSELVPVKSFLCIDPSLILFRIVHEGFKYLGVQITQSFTDLFKAHFYSLLGHCKDDFTKWSRLPLSLAGRINLVKMSVLPRSLYLFSNIPIFIRKIFFIKLDSLISSFQWENKRKSFIQRSKFLGGGWRCPIFFILLLVK